MSYKDTALPQDKDGRTYVTDLMLAQDPGLVDFLRRTQDSWERDNLCSRYILIKSAERS